MLGWLADFFRLVWGLLYWNVRKSWFQHRRGRSRCPCQSLSDSGRAYETNCEAAVTWDRQARFRRVCPLLVGTPDGLRCSVDAANVRPFWGIAARYYGASLLGFYAVAVIAVFVFLRTIGYPVSIVHVGLPPLWHKVGQARGWFFVDRANRAFAEGRTPEGLLYLASAYDYDPVNNYEAGLTLAKVSQVGQPARSDEMFQKLLRDHPARRNGTTQDWFRALLARGDFERIASLAHDQLLVDRTYAPVWIRALFFAVRQTGDARLLRDLLANPSPAAVGWHPLIDLEMLVRAGRRNEARAAIEREWPAHVPSFTLFYRVNALIEFGAALPALDLLGKHPGVLDPEAEVTLRLDAFAVNGSRANLNRQVDELLAGRLEPSSIKVVCAHLVRHPDAALFESLWGKLDRASLPVDNDTVGAWFSVLVTAGAVGDKARLHQITARLKESAATPFVALGVVEAFFRGELAERRITTFLPLLPLPLEVTYALLERYAQPRTAAAPAPSKGA